MNHNRFLMAMGFWLLMAGGLVGSVLAQGPEGSLEIQMASPAQGEIFYAAPSGVITRVPVSGRVVSYDAPIDLTTVELTLSLVDDSAVVAELQVPVQADGRFQVWATINAQGNLPILDDHLNDVCLSCHDLGDMTVPSNVSQLLIHARTPGGQTSSAVRDIKLDRGEFRTIEVQVAGLPAGSPAAQVAASTTVYEWRPRTFFAPVVDGQASLRVEGLSHADLAYEVTMTPLVVGAIRYEVEPQLLTLLAGSGSLSTTLRARPVYGTIAGRVVAGGTRNAIEDATVLVVDLATGESHETTTAADGSFRFDDLPVSEYVLLAESDAGVHLPERYDLGEQVSREVTVHLVRGGPDVLRGQVTLEGDPFPFAEVAVAGLLPVQADPLSGMFALPAVPADVPVEITVTAPGCYSVRRVTSDRDLGEVVLTLHPATTVLDRGGARLYLPAQTQASDTGDTVRLEQGVLWVTARGDGPGATVVAGSYRISGAGASYAVEALAGALPRLYVREGSVTAVRGAEQPVMISAGQTLTLLGERARPVELAPGAGALLRAVGGSVGRFELAPPVIERVMTAFWDTLEGAARVLMAGAYAITFGALPVFLAGGVIVLLRRRAVRRN